MNIKRRLEKLEQKAAPRGVTHYPSFDAMLDEMESRPETEEDRDRARYMKPCTFNLYGSRVGLDELIAVLNAEVSQ